MKLRLGFYPYTYARVAVMKSRLLKKQQLHTYLKMGIHELMRALQDGEYKAEMSELHPEKNTLVQLESALNRNMMRTFVKLKRISDDKVQHVLSIYFLRHDIENVKTIVRAKAAGAPAEEITPYLLPSINHPDELYVSLAGKESVADVIEALPFHVDVGDKADDLLYVENKLDRYYIDQLFFLSKNLAGQGNVFRAFIQAELENLNIKIVLRLLRAGLHSGDIQKLLIYPSQPILDALGHDISETLQKLAALGIVKDVSDYLAVEMEIDTQLLKREAQLMHQYPLTVNVILGFMLAKEIEVRNLKILLKGKKLNIDNAQLERLVVGA
ncbi:MAG TPA: V-type ATPase subunit [Candidatus Nanoarchaeia archaeon]|nr:V-type ATPase subunit [Candidatus Nanoarchaeia archaeon]